MALGLECKHPLEGILSIEEGLKVGTSFPLSFYCFISQVGSLSRCLAFYFFTPLVFFFYIFFLTFVRILSFWPHLFASDAMNLF
jgi:hypothetical protein